MGIFEIHLKPPSSSCFFLYDPVRNDHDDDDDGGDQIPSVLSLFLWEAKPTRKRVPHRPTMTTTALLMVGSRDNRVLGVVWVCGSQNGNSCYSILFSFFLSHLGKEEKHGFELSLRRPVWLFSANWTLKKGIILVAWWSWRLFIEVVYFWTSHFLLECTCSLDLPLGKQAVIFFCSRNRFCCDYLKKKSMKSGTRSYRFRKKMLSSIWEDLNWFLRNDVDACHLK